MWLHVSVEDAMRVEVKEGRDKLAGQRLDFFLRQVTVILQHLKQVPLSKLCHYAHLWCETTNTLVGA